MDREGVGRKSPQLPQVAATTATLHNCRKSPQLPQLPQGAGAGACYHWHMRSADCPIVRPAVQAAWDQAAGNAAAYFHPGA